MKSERKKLLEDARFYLKRGNSNIALEILLHACPTIGSSKFERTKLEKSRRDIKRLLFAYYDWIWDGFESEVEDVDSKYSIDPGFEPIDYESALGQNDDGVILWHADVEIIFRSIEAIIESKETAIEKRRVKAFSERLLGLIDQIKREIKDEYYSLAFKDIRLLVNDLRDNNDLIKPIEELKILEGKFHKFQIHRLTEYDEKKGENSIIDAPFIIEEVGRNLYLISSYLESLKK